ncbi:MAG TPA: hypothetical protein PLQ35_02220 [bacterium]|nr:hypothetical protein [bacterium]HQL61088.1 hypothetical protein [bacterium]
MYFCRKISAWKGCRNPLLILSAASIVIVASFPIGAHLGFGLVDDAYISMRYARNWAEGIGPFFNSGERVEGYTNFLWTVFLFAGAQQGIEPPQMAEQMGRVCLGLVIPVAFSLAFCITRSWAVALFAVALVLSDPGVWAWSLSGLETPLLTLLFTTVFTIWMRKGGGIRRELCLALLVSAAALTRPEGAAMFVYILARRGDACVAPAGMDGHRQDAGATLTFSHPDPLLKAKAENIPSFRRKPEINGHGPGAGDDTCVASAIVFVGIFIAVFGSCLLWRRWTYGLWLPNSFYAKHGFAGPALWWRGGRYVLDGCVAHPFWLLIPLGCFLGAWRDRAFIRLLGFSLFYLIIVALSGGDHYTLGRFCVPVVPILSILAAMGLQNACKQVSLVQKVVAQPVWKGLPATVSVVFAALCGVLNAGWGFEYQDGGYFHRSQIGWAEGWGRIGEIWREEVEPDTVIAVVTAGALPYISSLPTIDILGINDHHISQRDVPIGGGVAGHEKGDADYVLRRRPQRIQIAPMLLFQRIRTRYTEVPLEDVLTYPAQMELANHPVFQKSYSFVTEKTRFGYLSYHRYSNEGMKN